jgi:hypothetical protein
MAGGVGREDDGESAVEAGASDEVAGGEAASMI